MIENETLKIHYMIEKEPQNLIGNQKRKRPNNYK